jgi:trehalose-phosphatase
MIVMLDYDGTLVPIVQDPSRARIEPEKKRFLVELSKKHKLAIVTGRDFEGFKGVFGNIPETIYVITSHGASIYRNETLINRFSSSNLPDMTPLKEKLKKMEGVLLEEKEGCFALHYRKCKDEEGVRRIFTEFVKATKPVKVIEGKKVLEAVYGEVDKGKAVENFLKVIGWDGREPILYIGDDTTDLFALRKVKELGGRTLFVGDEKPQEADVLLKGVDEVYSFLSGLEESVNNE